MKENRWWWVLRCILVENYLLPEDGEYEGFFLVEDYLLPDELWSAWGRSDNSYLDEMMDTVNILWRCWFQSQLDQYYTTVGLQPIEVFQISKMELGVSRKKRYWWNWYLSRENQDVGSLGNYNNPTQPGLLLGVVLFIFVILLSYDNKVWIIIIIITKLNWFDCTDVLFGKNWTSKNYFSDFNHPHFNSIWISFNF